MAVFWGPDREPMPRDDSCSLCGHKDFRLCGCPWGEGFAEVPAYWVGRSKRVRQGGWPEAYLEWVRFVAPCPGRLGWRPKAK